MRQITDKHVVKCKLVDRFFPLIQYSCQRRQPTIHVHMPKLNKICMYSLSVMPEPGGPGGPSNFRQTRLPYSNRGRADYPHLTSAPPPFFHLPASLIVITQMGGPPLLSTTCLLSIWFIYFHKFNSCFKTHCTVLKLFLKEFLLSWQWQESMFQMWLIDHLVLLYFSD